MGEVAVFLLPHRAIKRYLRGVSAHRGLVILRKVLPLMYMFSYVSVGKRSFFMWLSSILCWLELFGVGGVKMDNLDGSLSIY